jgi:hypothetical protein
VILHHHHHDHHDNLVLPLLLLHRFLQSSSGMLFISGILLLYTAIVVPAQIFLWDYTDLCSKFPTLYFDAFVDIFFVVRRARLEWASVS